MNIDSLLTGDAITGQRERRVSAELPRPDEAARGTDAPGHPRIGSSHPGHPRYQGFSSSLLFSI